MQTPEGQQGKQTHSLLRLFYPEGRLVKALGMKVQQEERARRRWKVLQCLTGPLPVNCYLKGTNPQPISPVESNVMSPSSSPQGEDWGLRWETWEGWATGVAGNHHSLQVSGEHKSQDTWAFKHPHGRLSPQQPQSYLRTLFSRRREAPPEGSEVPQKEHQEWEKVQVTGSRDTQGRSKKY